MPKGLAPVVPSPTSSLQARCKKATHVQKRDNYMILQLLRSRTAVCLKTFEDIASVRCRGILPMTFAPTKSASALAALLASSISAMAADLPASMPVKAPPPPVFTWTGFYLGGGGGGGMWNAD